MLSENSRCNDHDLIFIALLEEGFFLDIHKNILLGLLFLEMMDFSFLPAIFAAVEKFLFITVIETTSDVSTFIQLFCMQTQLES